MNFSYFRLPQTIVTGKGSVQQIGYEVKKREASSVLIVTDQVIREVGLLSAVIESLRKEEIHFDIVDEVIQEPSFENLEQIHRKIVDQAYDLYIGIGGGSVLDSTKVLALMSRNTGDLREWIGTDKVESPGISTILIPTTSGTGSEVTCNAIFTDTRDMVKKGIVSPHLFATVALIDPELTYTVPCSVAAATGMDALVHAIESYISVHATTLTDGIALEAIRMISGSIRSAVHHPLDEQAKEQMAIGSMMAGIAFGNAGVGAVHALAYPLGGKFKVPHGIANSMLLVSVMKYNYVVHLDRFAEIAKAMGENISGLSLHGAADRALVAMEDLARDLEIPSSLREFGVQEEDIPTLAKEASQIDRLLRNNPRQLTVQEMEQIYRSVL